MSEPHIILYLITALLVVFYVRRFIQRSRMKEYTPRQVAGLVSDGSVILLDVRTTQERSQQHIKGSLHIPLNELLDRLKVLEQYRGKEIICYCRSGSRSISAAAMLQKQGFRAVNMRGGIVEWNYQNLR